MTKHNKYYWDLDRNKPYKDYLGSSDKNNEELNNKREMKQTAVGFLMDKLFDPSTMIEEQIQWFHQAAQMEKEQMCEFAESFEYSFACGDVKNIEEHFEKTFNTNEK